MPPFLLYVVAIATGLATAWSNIRTDAPWPIIVQMLVAGGLAALAPRRAWRWALLTGAPAALVQFLGSTGLFQTPYENESWHAVVTLLPGFAAAYAAVMLRTYPERRAFDRGYAARKAAATAASDPGEGDTPTD